MWFNLDLLQLELSRLYQSILRTKEVHALIFKTHLSQDPFYATRIIRFYAINGDFCNARKLFDKSPNRSVYLWNSVIRAHAQAHRFDDAFSLFKDMSRSEIKPDSFTYACIIRACSERLDLDCLKLVHGGVIVSGLGFDSICCSALVTAYSKLDLVAEASNVFNGISEPDLVLWNCMISGFGNCGSWDKGLELFIEMQRMGKRPDGYTLVGLLMGLAGSSLLGVGQVIHGFSLKNNFVSSVHVCSVLVSMYAKCNSMGSAYRVFCGLYQPDLVTWSALITGYAQTGEYENALLFFRKSILQGNKADSVLLASVLSAAAQLGNVVPGCEIHACIVRVGLESDVMVSSALVDMYSKCGFLDLGFRVFEVMPERNIVSYNALILGLGLHGLASHAFKKFEEVQENGLIPGESTFSALLCACCHSGLVKDGQNIFKRMKDEFRIQAKVEHYVHMVKLLGMNGGLEEAFNLILSLPEPVDSGIWGALLSCCDACGNSKLAEIVAQQLIGIEPENCTYRVMLSNTYAGYGRWEDARKMRDNITEDKLKKLPGEELLELLSRIPHDPMYLLKQRQQLHKYWKRFAASSVNSVISHNIASSFLSQPHHV